jgi:hypothetical protein
LQCMARRGDPTPHTFTTTSPTCHVVRADVATPHGRYPSPAGEYAAAGRGNEQAWSQAWAVCMGGTIPGTTTATRICMVAIVAAVCAAMALGQAVAVSTPLAALGPSPVHTGRNVTAPGQSRGGTVGSVWVDKPWPREGVRHTGRGGVVWGPSPDPGSDPDPAPTLSWSCSDAAGGASWMVRAPRCVRA